MPQRKTSSGFTPVTFTKDVDGRVHERTALTASDEVQLTYDGWLPKGKKAPKAVTESERAAARTSGSVAPGTSTSVK